MPIDGSCRFADTPPMVFDGEILFGGGSLLLTALSAADRDSLLALSNRASFAPGETIFSYGEPGETLLVIQSGRVEVSITSRTGRKSVLNHVGPGEAVGEVALLDGGPRTADVTAATAVTAHLLHRRDIVEFLHTSPDATMALIAELCAKVRNSSEMFAAQSQTGANVRLARCLLRLALKWGEDTPEGGTRIGRSFSQTELGEFSGLARENVNRHLKAWMREGIVRFEGRDIVVTDIQALEALAQI